MDISDGFTRDSQLPANEWQPESQKMPKNYDLEDTLRDILPEILAPLLKPLQDDVRRLEKFVWQVQRTTRHW